MILEDGSVRVVTEGFTLWKWDSANESKRAEWLPAWNEDESVDPFTSLLRDAEPGSVLVVMGWFPLDGVEGSRPSYKVVTSDGRTWLATKDAIDQRTRPGN